MISQLMKGIGMIVSGFFGEILSFVIILGYNYADRKSSSLVSIEGTHYALSDRTSLQSPFILKQLLQSGLKILKCQNGRDCLYVSLHSDGIISDVFVEH